MQKYLLSFFGLAFFSSVLADDAKVLPRNRWRLRVITSFSMADDKLDSSGVSSALGDPFTRSIDARLLSALAPDPKFKEFIQMKNALRPGSGDAFLSESVADISTQISSNILATTLVAEYGLTDRLSLGIILPIVRGETSVELSSNSNNQFKSTMSALGEKAPENIEKGVRAKLLGSTTTSSINQLLQERLGYSDGLANWSETGLGDLEVGMKYNYYRDHPLQLTAKGGLRAPTGRTDDPDQLMDMGFGDGQFDIGFFNLADYDILSTLSTTWELGYTVQLPHSATYRIPISNELPIGSTRMELDHTPGDFWESSLELNINPITRWTFSPRYRFKQKFKDEFEGPDGRLAVLEIDTSQIVHEGQFQIEYTNLPAVKAGQERWPYGLTAFYRTVFAGQNATRFQTAGCQLKTYF